MSGYAWAHLVDKARERFDAFVEVQAGGCHLWTGARSRGSGNTAWYGSFNVGGGLRG